MMPNQDPRRNEEAARAMRLRILNVLPAATYQMDQFLQLADVVVSERSATAAVEVGPQPRLHLNAGFIARYCRRDEHLLMLIMHELYHIILGHTRLFPRVTEAHNIVFDAIINAMLCQQFPEAQYVAFFRQVNRSRRFPARLLRPPAGWLEGRMRFSPAASEKERKVMRLLYGERAATATYQEVFELLAEDLHGHGGASSGHDGDTVPPCARPGGGFVLLGDHAGGGRSGTNDDAATGDALVKDILRRVMGNWPDDARRRLQRGAGIGPMDFLLPKPRSPRAAFQEALKGLLAKAGVLQPGPGSPYAWQQRQSGYEYTTVLPNWRDRHAFSREALHGAAPMLYRDEGRQPRPRWSPRNVAHVYVDVSGSMLDALPWLVAALDPLNRRGAIRLFAFSTVVAEVRRGRLDAMRVRNTLGTDINCVYEHALSLPRSRTPHRIVLLTDCDTGRPTAELLARGAQRGLLVSVGLVGDGSGEDLRGCVARIAQLPDLA